MYITAARGGKIHFPTRRRMGTGVIASNTAVQIEGRFNAQVRRFSVRRGGADLGRFVDHRTDVGLENGPTIQALIRK